MRVLCSGAASQELQSVRLFRRVTAVFEIRFDPDEPLGAFVHPNMVPSSMSIEQPETLILLKGHGRLQTRRGGMNRRGLARQDAEDCASVPDPNAPLTLKLESLIGQEDVILHLRSQCGPVGEEANPCSPEVGFAGRVGMPRLEKAWHCASVVAARACLDIPSGWFRSVSRCCSRRSEADDAYKISKTYVRRHLRRHSSLARWCQASEANFA